MVRLSEKDSPDTVMPSRVRAAGRPARDSVTMWFATFFASAVVVRVIYLFLAGIPTDQDGDQQSYMTLARNVATGYGFTKNGIPYTYRPPLFSSLLGVWCYLLGSTSPVTMVAFQVLIQSLAAALTYILIRLISPIKVFALAGGFFVVIYPFIFSNVGFILQEPLQMLVTAATAIALIVWCRRPTLLRAVVLGFFFGLGALAKAPNLIAPLIVLFVWLLGSQFRRQLPIRQVLVMAMVMIGLVLPWTLRNYFVSGGRLIPVNSQDTNQATWLVADGNFKIRKSLSDAPEENSINRRAGILLAYGSVEGVTYLTRTNDELLAQGISGQALDAGMRSAAISYLLHHPGQLFKQTGRGIILLISPDARSLFAGSPAIRLAAMMLVQVPLFVGFIAGALKASREKQVSLTILSMLAITQLLIHAPVAVGGGRYTAPMVPILIGLAAYSVPGFLQLGKLPRLDHSVPALQIEDSLAPIANVLESK